MSEPAIVSRNANRLTADQLRYVRRETLVSVVINSALSLGFALLFLGGRAAAPVWGPRGVALDFAPQVFMVVLATTLATTLLTRQRLRAGSVSPLARERGGVLARAPRAAFLRALLLGAAAAVVLAPLSAAVLAAIHPADLAAGPFLVMKTLYGALLALVAAPPILRAALAAD